MDKNDKKPNTKFIRDFANKNRKHRLKLKKNNIEELNNIIINEIVNK